MVKVAVAAALAAAVFDIAQSAPSTDLSTLVRRVQSPAIPSGYTKQIFVDNFSWSTGAPDPGRWQYVTGHGFPGGPANWGTGEIQSYTTSADNIRINLANDVLEIAPQKTANGWTSARIQTQPVHDFACPAGGKVRIEARFKVSTGVLAGGTENGIWPSFWLLGSAFRGNYNNWPSVGEIDIMETVDGLPRIYNVVHCGTNPGGVCNEPSGIAKYTFMSRGEWHTVRLDINRNVANWLDESIVWYLDGVQTQILRPSSVGNNKSAWDSLAATKKMMILNVAVGGGFADALAGKTTPTERTVWGLQVGLQVDYVVVWST